jgi:hypothetical protein
MRAHPAAQVGPQQDEQWKCDPNAIKVIVPASVTRLDRESFREAAKLEEIRFEPGSQLIRLEAFSFYPGASLKSICIPASVEFIGGFCFTRPDSIHSDSAVSSVTF